MPEVMKPIEPLSDEQKRRTQSGLVVRSTDGPRGVPLGGLLAQQPHGVGP